MKPGVCLVVLICAGFSGISTTMVRYFNGPTWLIFVAIGLDLVLAIMAIGYWSTYELVYYDSIVARLKTSVSCHNSRDPANQISSSKCDDLMRSLNQIRQFTNQKEIDLHLWQIIACATSYGVISHSDQSLDEIISMLRNTALEC